MAGATLAALLLAHPVAHAKSDKDCQRPRPPEVPQASDATDIDMIAARQRIKMFLEAGSTYLACLDQAREDVGTTARELKLNRIQKKRDEMETEMKAVAEQFNVQVRRFKERSEAASEPEDTAKTADASPGEKTAAPTSGPLPSNDSVLPDY